MKSVSRRHRRLEGQLAAVVHETLSSMETVKAFGREDFANRVFGRSADANLQASLAATKLECQVVPIVRLTSALGVVAAVCVGIVRVSSAVVSPGDLWVFLTYVKEFHRLLKELSKDIRRLVRAQVQWERIDEILRPPAPVIAAVSPRAVSPIRRRTSDAAVAAFQGSSHARGRAN
jgi:ATP-binding cassette subfamily B protein